MSSKPPKPNQNNSSSTQFQQQPLLNYPSLYMNSDDLHLPSTHAAAEPDNTFYRRNSHGKGFELDEHEGAFMLAKLGAAASDHVAASHDQEQGRSGIGFTERFKRWSFENERGGGTVQGNNMQSYSMSPLLEIAGAQNDHSLLSSAAAGAGARAGGGGSSEIREGGHGNLVQGSLGSSVGESINVGYLPLSNLEAEFANTKPQYSTQDMEILSVTQGHNPSSGSVQQQQQQQLYEQQIPSSLTPHNLASYLNFTAHRSPTSYPTNDHLRLQHNQHLQLLGDHHQWGTGLHTTSSSSHPHAELLLLPGVAESVVEASPTSPHTAAFSSSKLDLLHGSSLHDKQAHMLGVGAVAGGGGRMPAAAQMWHIDKLDMAVGLGLRDHSARSSMFAQDVDHFASTRQAQSGLSLFLQSPQDRAQTGLSLDAARYSSRSASGSLGVLRNSKYLKAAQQLLNEFCNVCRDAIPDVKSSIAAASISQHIWNATGVAAAEENIAGNRAFLSSTEKDMNLYSHADHYKLGSSSDYCSSQHLKLSDDHDQHQQEQPPADHGSAGSPPCASLDNPPPPPPPHKQLPADERCHLQMRKARLIAMVEELDRRYQQYRDQMQLIVTSFESATGMGAAAAYTTLWRKGMSRQFRGLRDTIGEHIRKVCRLLGEEVSSVPILSRGETPRLRLVDQRLRHQRSLQQIGMLPQQQAWRPQRGLPERSVSVLRAWLFEHFLHPYPKDSEKSMLARLTGLSRNQVSNWFINARVRLWKPMIEEMYVEESKALELSEAEASTAGEVTRGAAAVEGGSISSDHSSRESWQAAAAAPAAAAAHYASASANLYDTRQQHRSDDFSNFIHFHGGASRANDPHIAAATDMQGHAEVSSQAQYSWMKSMQAQAQAQAAGDIGVLTHDHMRLQAAALMAQGQLNASSSFMKNGVSLTLGLQQPPPHSSYNTSSSAYARPSEALLF